MIDRYRDAGVARLAFSLPPAAADIVLPRLDKLRQLTAAYAR